MENLKILLLIAPLLALSGCNSAEDDVDFVIKENKASCDKMGGTIDTSKVNFGVNMLMVGPFVFVGSTVSLDCKIQK